MFLDTAGVWLQILFVMPSYIRYTLTGILSIYLYILNFISLKKNHLSTVSCLKKILASVFANCNIISHLLVWISFEECTCLVLDLNKCRTIHQFLGIWKLINFVSQYAVIVYIDTVKIDWSFVQLDDDIRHSNVSFACVCFTIIKELDYLFIRSLYNCCFGLDLQM